MLLSSFRFASHFESAVSSDGERVDQPSAQVPLYATSCAGVFFIAKLICVHGIGVSVAFSKKIPRPRDRQSSGDGVPVLPETAAKMFDLLAAHGDGLEHDDARWHISSRCCIHLLFLFHLEI